MKIRKLKVSLKNFFGIAATVPDAKSGVFQPPSVLDLEVAQVLKLFYWINLVANIQS